MSRRAMPRVRSESPAIGALIARAYAVSVTFRRLVDAIDRTDGIVYVQPGRCGNRMSACMPHALVQAGPSRLLQVWVATRRPDCELMVSIGHELEHTIEVLQEPKLTSSAALFFFYAREGRHLGGNGDPLGPWETEGAVETGLRVLDELRQDPSLACPPPPLRLPSTRSASVAPGVLRR